MDKSGAEGDSEEALVSGWQFTISVFFRGGMVPMSQLFAEICGIFTFSLKALLALGRASGVGLAFRVVSCVRLSLWV